MIKENLITVEQRYQGTKWEDFGKRGRVGSGWVEETQGSMRIITY